MAELNYGVIFIAAAQAMGQTHAKASLRGVRRLADDEAIPWRYNEIATPPLGGSQ